MAQVLVGVGRVRRWIENFATRHGGGADLSVSDGALHGVAPDGSTFVARLPFERPYDGPADPAAFAAAGAPPADWGVLLVRKGGFAVARLHGTEITASKVGKRHVQGKTKAGGWSQQRFARRRDNQARAAMAAADEHAARILDHLDGPLIYGGVEDARPEDTVLLPGHVPDPRREVLNKAIADAQAALFSVINAEDR
ncbi:acVLRF1 family peptidyl-tRNA hydrolase [Nocardioides nematodiphilus]|uniref:acVLRF1 family peptidyl-tRNA hydrolase n=1 Tax=Nocardioides nematodiphilus TaxID=2849669 RepID=UPI001CD9F286|nr:acVLRF1 family peptidyl-tRNA hydrolase [Nocardioides nematodiphilus]MCA1981931.1 hypothetical protein [Nocardioides nematodiphilus]